MKQSITEMARSIKLTGSDARKKEMERVLHSRAERLADVLQSFRDTFAEFIPMIEEEGIRISAHFKSEWDHDGTYVLFKKGYSELRMDYHDAITYRFEYTPATGPARIGRSVYGAWPKENLILYIYDEMLSKEEGRD